VGFDVFQKGALGGVLFPGCRGHKKIKPSEMFIRLGLPAIQRNHVTDGPKKLLKQPLSLAAIGNRGVCFSAWEAMWKRS
jgi:hypothetical protein